MVRANQDRGIFLAQLDGTDGSLMYGVDEWIDRQDVVPT